MEAPESRRSRLEFQRQTYEVQSAVNTLVRNLNDMIREARAQTVWSEALQRRAEEIKLSAYDALDRLLELSPPTELLRSWDGLVNKMERLAPVIDEFINIGSASGDRRRSLFDAFMSHYRQWFQEMNAMEAELLEQEMNLAGLRPISSWAAKKESTDKTGPEA